MVNDPAESFDRSALAYEELVALNRAGSRRLIAALPDGEYRRVLDVGCGTGFATMQAVARGGVTEVIGVDPSQPMLDVFAGHLSGHLVITADLRESLAATEAEAHELRVHCAKHVETLRALGTVLDAAGRVARDQSHAHDMMQAAIDCAPMRNIMSTASGLGPCGEPLQPKRTRKKAA
jgi:trans-aconitate methyltransferase